jgi:hypothetical protein
MTIFLLISPMAKTQPSDRCGHCVFTTPAVVLANAGQGIDLEQTLMSGKRMNVLKVRLSSHL